MLILNSLTMRKSYNFVIHTVIHELGHNLGLDDEYKGKDGRLVKNDPNNLMGAGDSYNITNTQKQVMFYRYSANGSGKIKTQRNAVSEGGNSKLDTQEMINKDAKITTK